MKSSYSMTGLSSLLSVCLLLMVSVTPANADMMKACKTEISAQCKGVKNGRGRIAACLYAHPNKLSGSCKIEVDKVSTGRTVKLVIPAGVWKLSGSPYEGNLVKACTGDAQRLCSGASRDKHRQLACLYSQSNKISGSCKQTAKRIINQLK
ncbi:MAG: hypothetical protein ABJP66_08105 [Hyphomicrobiales bacterium]